VLPVLVEDQVVLVTDQDRPVGILTRIDALEFIAHRI
jgi:predicted transcriptional regulator